MTRFVSVLVCLCTWNLGVAQDLMISNARIIDGAGRIIDSGSIIVSDGRIVTVAAGASTDQVAHTLDANGMTVMPGLIDTHWHLLAASGAATDQSVEDYIRNVVTESLEATLSRGVTTIMSTGDHLGGILAIRQRLRDGDMRGPRLLVVGPVFTAPDDWPTQLCKGRDGCKSRVTAEVTVPDQARAKVRELAAAGVDAVKVVYDDEIVPDVRISDEVVAAIAEEATAQGLTLYAHISTIDETALRIVELGARAFVHPVSLRSPESGNGAQVLRDLQIPISSTVGMDSQRYREAAGKEYTQRREASYKNQLETIHHLWESGVTIAFGTDSIASPGPLNAAAFLSEAQSLNQILSNAEVIQTLTRNAAIYLGLDSELGTLEKGKIADILIIDGDPLTNISDLTNVQVVIQGGQIIVDNR